jgi:hypothetical protein
MYAIPAAKKWLRCSNAKQVDDWYPELVAQEAKAKDEAEVVLFVISGGNAFLSCLFKFLALLYTLVVQRHARSHL